MDDKITSIFIGVILTLMSVFLTALVVFFIKSMVSTFDDTKNTSVFQYQDMNGGMGNAFNCYTKDDDKYYCEIIIPVQWYADYSDIQE